MEGRESVSGRVRGTNAEGGTRNAEGGMRNEDRGEGVKRQEVREMTSREGSTEYRSLTNENSSQSAGAVKGEP